MPISEEYKRKFINTVVLCKPNMIYVDIDNNTLNRIDVFAKEVIKKKSEEKHHKIDNASEYTRFFTGMIGECAVERAFHCQFVDWSIGESTLYHKADLQVLGIRVGIKTVEMYKFPIIFKQEKYPELICIRRNVNTVILCGLASVPVLRKYQDDNLVISDNLRMRGTKTGFYGFNHLIKVSSLEDVKRWV